MAVKVSSEGLCWVWFGLVLYFHRGSWGYAVLGLDYAVCMYVCTYVYVASALGNHVSILDR